MPSRLINTFWVLLLLVMALLAGGGVANHLSNLEQNTLRAWQEQLTAAGREKANETASYLEAQQQLLNEILKEPVISAYLEQTSRQADAQPATADVRRALDDTADLKYGLNHTYIFGADSQLLVRQPDARNLPLKVREDLDKAYRTGLESYMFFTTFENKTWFVASRRAQKNGRGLGYGAFLLEASAAMDPLRNSVFRWRFLDFNLARRSGDSDVYIVSWKDDLPTTKKYDIAQTNLPLFRGTSNAFNAVTLLNGKKRLVFTSSVPTFTFWQHLTSVPVEFALSDVRQTRFFYLFGLGVFLLFVFAFMVGFVRRIFDPSLPIIPESITRIKSGNIPKSVPSTNKKERPHKPLLEKVKEGASPRNFLSGIMKMAPWMSRTLSEEEKQRLKQKSTAPENTQEPHDTSTPETKKFESGSEKKKPEVIQPTAEELAEEQRLAQEKAEKEQVKQIHRCIQNEKYRLYFQPILQTDNKNKIMFETLLRLVNDKGELMQPGEFFPLAIKHGFVDQVDDMVIVASLRRHMEILSQGKSHMLSINLSYGAFSSLNFMNTFKEGLKSGKLKPELLNFELSSKEIIEDESAMKFVREMQKSGAKFSVDFFGDPAKTVKAAKKLKFDYMKVDCLKFDGLSDGDKEQTARFKQVVDAGKEAGLPLIAEKVETKTVLALCEKLDVAYVQGFYLAEPSPKLTLGW
mgnify:CR=1 FL=1